MPAVFYTIYLRLTIVCGLIQGLCAFMDGTTDNLYTEKPPVEGGRREAKEAVGAPSNNNNNNKDFKSNASTLK